METPITQHPHPNPSSQQVHAQEHPQNPLPTAITIVTNTEPTPEAPQFPTQNPNPNLNQQRKTCTPWNAKLETARDYSEKCNDAPSLMLDRNGRTVLSSLPPLLMLLARWV